jgi:dTDP-4-amino-4,6-dideoxygalactose transaminase
MPSDIPIPFIRPAFPPPAAVAAAYEKIVDANWYTNFGPVERRLSSALAAYVGPQATATTAANATLALIAAIECTVGHGDGTGEILVPSFTFVAAAQAVTWSGHVPRFVDISPETWQPDASHARALVSAADRAPRGILLANVFGVGNPDIADWEALAEELSVPLVIDSAAGFGSWYPNGERLGTRGTCEVFSMHATKPFGVGEGAIVTTRDDELARRIERFENFGFDASRSSVSLGLNAKLPELSAAIGLLQLDGLDARLDGRREVHARYRDALSDRFSFQVNADRSTLGFASLAAPDAAAKQAALARLAAGRIDARDYYNPPVHRQPLHLAGQPSHLPVTDDLCSRILSVPIHDAMAPADIERVVTALRQED